MNKDHLILVVSSIGVIQATFLAFYFLSLRTGNRIAQMFLAVVLMGLSIRIGKSIFNHYFELSAWHRNVGLVGLLICGPSIYLYGRSMADKLFKVTAKIMTHYALALAYLCFCWVIPNAQNLASYVSYALVLLHLITYLAFSYQSLSGLMQNVSIQFKNWYQQLLFGLALIWLYYLLVFMGVIPYYLGGAVFYSGLVYAFSYMLMKRHHVQFDKYKQTQLNHVEAKALVNQFRFYLNAHQPYTNPSFNLTQAAKLMSVKNRELSRAINENAGMNFSEFINQYKVDLAKKMIVEAQGSQVKLAVVGLECGFANTTSFNQVFKRLVGQTPSSFKETV